MNLIIDGISNTGRTTLLKEIKNRIYSDSYKYSQIFISEHLTERFFEGKANSIDLVGKHIVKILNAIKCFNDINSETKFVSKNILSVCIERLFLAFYANNLLSENFY